MSSRYYDADGAPVDTRPMQTDKSRWRLTAPELPRELTAADVEAVINYIQVFGRDAAISQAVLNDLGRE